MLGFVKFFSRRSGRRKNRKRRGSSAVTHPPKTREELNHHIRKERLRRKLADDDRRLLRKKRRVTEAEEVYKAQERSMKPLESHDISPNQGMRFTSPSLTPTCIRRELRRKFLFAIGFAGRGKVKSAKWTENSKVRC